MKLHRFFGNFDLSRSSVRLVEREVLDQLRNVLRLAIGDTIILADGKSNEALAEIKELNQKFAELVILERSQNGNEPNRQVVLYCSILKRENFELVVQKATEAGVKRIVPIISKRTVKLNINHERLEKIIKEAAEQSGRGMIPVLSEAMTFDQALEAGGCDVNVLFHLGGKDIERASLGASDSVGVWIGPEGGWDEEEVESAKARGFKIGGLGKLTLRGETAAIVASYMIINL